MYDVASDNRLTDRNSFKKILADPKEENKLAKSPVGGNQDHEAFKHPLMKASPRHSMKQIPQGMQRGISETSFNFPLLQM